MMRVAQMPSGKDRRTGRTMYHLRAISIPTDNLACLLRIPYIS
jgi:hypothetical protein